MLLKAGCLFVTLLAVSLAFPLNEEDDVSFYFDNHDVAPLIVGGSTAGRVPHMVALTTGVFTRSFTCGASLVTARHIMTAAHCIEAVFSGGSLLNSLRAVVGTNRWNSGGTQIEISRNITHPNYVRAIIKNDIGILVTSSNVGQNNNVRIVPLNYDFIGNGVAARVNGWGRTRAGGSLSATLMELRTTVIDGARCVTDVARRAAELNLRNIPAVQPHIEVCTFLATDRGTCHGDSGSALVRQSDGAQIGVVSWGLPCARGAPDMYARVSAYRNWIQQSIR